MEVRLSQPLILGSNLDSTLPISLYSITAAQSADRLLAGQDQLRR